MLSIKKSEFIKSAADKNGFIMSELGQIVVGGKSNVGKSSFINFLCNNYKLARTSNTPGRTRLVNYFLINNDFFLVDLPGYGYAKGAKGEIEYWAQMMNDYFETSKDVIKRVIFLVDCRHLPTNEDLKFASYLNYYRLPFSVIATKADKLSRAQLNRNLVDIANALKIGRSDIFAVSSQNRLGKEEVLSLIERSLAFEEELVEDLEETEN